MAQDVGLNLTPKLMETFKAETTFGAPLDKLPGYLAMAPGQRSKMLPKMGIPLDSINGGQSEFQQWVYAYENQMGTADNVKIAIKSDSRIAIKSDSRTPYKTVRKVMDELQALGVSDYYLITELKNKQED